MTGEFYLKDVVRWFGHPAMVIGKTYRAPMTYDIAIFRQGENPIYRNGVVAEDLERVEQ